MNQTFNCHVQSNKERHRAISYEAVFVLGEGSKRERLKLQRQAIKNEMGSLLAIELETLSDGPDLGLPKRPVDTGNQPPYNDGR